MSENTAQTLIAGVAKEAGALATDIVDMAGEIDDIAAQFKRQTALFEQLRTTAGELAKSNGQIVRAAESAGQVAHMATDDMANSRRTVEQSRYLRNSGFGLVEAVAYCVGSADDESWPLHAFLAQQPADRANRIGIAPRMRSVDQLDLRLERGGRFGALG